MATGGRPSMNKRQKEQRRLEQRKEKEEKKRRRQEEPARPRAEDGVDPDIAHIVPGPQPLPY